MSFVIEKLLLRVNQSREEDALLLISEDLTAKCLEIEKRLDLNPSYFPFIMLMVTRILNKGFESLAVSLDPVLAVEFHQQATGAMANFNETLYKRYFLIIRKQSIFDAVSTDPRNLEIFKYRQGDKDKLVEEYAKYRSTEGRPLFPPTFFRPYLPFAEYVKVALNDVSLLFGLMKFENHQRFIIGHYNWSLYRFIQILVDRFKDDINDFSMNSLKKSLGFKDLLTSDYSYFQFVTHLKLSGMEEEEKHAYLAEDEYFKALSSTYGQLGNQISSLPLDAFREDKYQKVAENCAIVLSCFESVKLSFNLNLHAMLLKL